MIKVWTDSQEAGMLDRSGGRGSSFAYATEALASRAVSATMPVRLSSWDIRFGFGQHRLLDPSVLFWRHSMEIRAGYLITSYGFSCSLVDGPII